MKRDDMRNRTKAFALRVIKMYSQLPKGVVAQVLGKQVLRSGTSVAANYREACRARSDAELLSRLGLVEGEIDESMLWMELLVESDTVPTAKMVAILKEADELIRIVVTAGKTTRQRVRGKKKSKPDPTEG